ncbi:MAG: PhoD-like phosphatase N-terminal domain-containing protein, partial [Pseudomonadota bacterium]
MDISRRQALWGTLLGASGIAGCATEMNRQSTTPLPYRASIAFAHGVASGDPALDSVVIWTRVTTQDPVIPVEAEISQTQDFSSIVKIFRTETSQNQDYTVKIIADGLEPGQTYFYRFRVGNDISPIGRTKTLPDR